ncbi:MAG: hypothetical protein ABIC91_06150 [Nanoarchaeota archaeon]|nr:hypothetical protein [Nanoarchaeota archaeon]MBU1029779.1 hypothetical protein [Nanoarchaeota archaeon]MBU1849216.1 hypothetical protein [Nanoarchaeota archaeon]
MNFLKSKMISSVLSLLILLGYSTSQAKGIKTNSNMNVTSQTRITTESELSSYILTSSLSPKSLEVFKKHPSTLDEQSKILQEEINNMIKKQSKNHYSFEGIKRVEDKIHIFVKPNNKTSENEKQLKHLMHGLGIDEEQFKVNKETIYFLASNTDLSKKDLEELMRTKSELLLDTTKNILNRIDSLDPSFFASNHIAQVRCIPEGLQDIRYFGKHNLANNKNLQGRRIFNSKQGHIYAYNNDKPISIGTIISQINDCNILLINSRVLAGKDLEVQIKQLYEQTISANFYKKLIVETIVKDFDEELTKLEQFTQDKKLTEREILSLRRIYFSQKELCASKLFAPELHFKLEQKIDEYNKLLDWSDKEVGRITPTQKQILEEIYERVSRATSPEKSFKEQIQQQEPLQGVIFSVPRILISNIEQAGVNNFAGQDAEMNLRATGFGVSYKKQLEKIKKLYLNLEGSYAQGKQKSKAATIEETQKVNLLDFNIGLTGVLKENSFSPIFSLNISNKNLSFDGNYGGSQIDESGSKLYFQTGIGYGTHANNIQLLGKADILKSIFGSNKFIFDPAQYMNTAEVGAKVNMGFNDFFLQFMLMYNDINQENNNYSSQGQGFDFNLTASKKFNDFLMGVGLNYSIFDYKNILWDVPTQTNISLNQNKVNRIQLSLDMSYFLGDTK